MSSAAPVSLVLLCFSTLYVVVGLVPCFGWVNWFGVPLSMLTALSGLLGLCTDRDPVTREMRGVAIHVAALLLGGILTLVAVVRCALGLGMV